VAKLQNVDISLKEITDYIKAGKMGVPAMQRDFVYKKKDIESLGDSLIRGYPISSMLTMPKNGTLQVKVEALKTDGAKLDEDNYDYVLDGQQRLTSIAKIFCGLDSQTEYYFDLLSILVEAFPEDRILDYKFFGDQIRAGKSREPDETLCVALKRKTNVDEDYREYYRYMSGSILMENKFASIVNKFLKYLFSEEYLDEDEVEKLSDKYMDHLNSLLGAVSGYGVPITIIPADSDLGMVCRVFETVNKTGIRLSTYDLINAKSFSYDGYKNGLTEFLRKSLKEFEHGIDKTSEYMREFFAYDAQRGHFAELGRIVRMLEISHYLARDTQPSIKNSEMLKRDPSVWFDGWVEKRQAFVDYVTYLGNNDLIHGTAPISYLEYVGGVVLNEPKLLKNTEFTEILKRYGLMIAFTGQSFNKSNLQVVMQFLHFGQHLMSAKGIDAKSTDLKPTTSLIVEVPQIRNIKIKQTACNAMFYIMYREHHDGKFINDIMGSRIDYDGEFDIHHIAPKSFGKGQESLYNCAGNLMLLNSYSNRVEVKDQKLSDYLDQIKVWLGNENFGNVMKDNILPLDYADLTDEEFINLRSEKLAEYIQSYFSR